MFIELLFIMPKFGKSVQKIGYGCLGLGDGERIDGTKLAWIY